jgi:hypothetical protein
MRVDFLRYGLRASNDLAIVGAHRGASGGANSGGGRARVRSYRDSEDVVLESHANSSASASGVPSLSLPESSGSALNGHWMPMVGSFHRMLRSNSGAQ